MKRLGIFSFYDENGNVAEYIDYLLSDLSIELDRLIVVVNGNLSSDGRCVFGKYTSEILIRENEGFDAGAYAFILLKYIKYDELKKYDEIVLCNDTFYGPFISFGQIFSVMEEKKYDLWGLNIVDRGFLSYIQSYFLVFGRHIIEDGSLIDFFSQINMEEKNINNVYATFETGLYYYFMDDYSIGSYVDTKLVDVYRSAIVCVERYGLPIIKVKAFDEKYTPINSQVAMINYIKKINYDEKLILADNSSLSECYYDNEFLCDDNIFVARRLDKTKEGPRSIERWVGDNHFYIYGAGKFARETFRFGIRGTKSEQYFNGFVVSDKSNVQDKKIMGYKVFSLKEVGTDIRVLLGVGKNLSQEIVDSLPEGVEYLTLC